jgi:glycosyltransferase involved in cell wall biosynthesis
MTKTIAIVSPINPIPCNAESRQRIFHTARCLKNAGFSISMIICDASSSGPAPEELRDICDRVHVVPPPARRSFVKRLASFFLGSPVPRYPDIAANIARVIEEWGPDCVHINKTFLCGQINLRGLRKKSITTVLDEGGVYHLIYQRKAIATATPSQYVLWMKRAGKLKKYEARTLSMVDAVTAVNPAEAELLRAMNPSATILHVPNGIDNDTWSKALQPLVKFYFTVASH